METIGKYAQYLICISIVTILAIYNSLVNSLIVYSGSALILLSISWKLLHTISARVGRTLMSGDGKAVLITGCDSGFGNALALALNRLGVNVIATCFDATRAEQQLVSGSRFPQKMNVMQLDVTSDADVQKCLQMAVELLARSGDELWAVVNNAGVFGVGFAEWAEVSAYQKAIEVNLLGSVRVTKAFLPLLRKSKGRLIFVSSIAARLTAAGYAVYCVSKRATQAFIDTLRKELRMFGIRVISVEPSCYRTPLIANVSTLMDKCWAETSQLVREAYGQQVFRDYKQSFATSVERARDPTEVVDAMVDAILSSDPFARYKCCGLLMDLIWTANEHIPDEMSDDVWNFMFQLTNNHL